MSRGARVSSTNNILFKRKKLEKKEDMQGDLAVQLRVQVPPVTCSFSLGKAFIFGP
jgi:hypothetical protein